MAHVLVLRSKQHDEVTKRMLDAAAEVINLSGNTYDEIVVPTPKELPTSLNIFAESLNYEATICIGLLRQSEFEDSKVHYQEIVSAFYDFSTYFGHIVGAGLAYSDAEELNISKLEEFSCEVASSVCDLLKTVREINSLEGNRYAGTTKHN